MTIDDPKPLTNVIRFLSIDAIVRAGEGHQRVPLGQGIANAFGMAIAEAFLGVRFGTGIVDHHTYVCSSATISGSSLSDVISQAAVMSLIHMQRLAVSQAIQSMRNTG